MVMMLAMVRRAQGRGPETIARRVRLRALVVINGDWDHVGCRAIWARFRISWDT